MKVALLLCGLAPENFEKYYPSIKKTLIEPFSSDIFISSWKSDYSDDLFSLYNPKLIRLENLEDISIKHRLNEYLNFLHEIDYTGNKSISMNNRYTMFYKIFDANQLRKEYEKRKGIEYDLIIRSRFDLSFEHRHSSCTLGPFLYNCIIDSEINSSLKEDKLFLRMDGGGDFVWDQFAFGNNKNMDIYCDTFLNLEKLVQPNFLCSEQLLYRQLTNNNVQISHTMTTYNIKNL